MNYIRITKDNIDKEHICCAMSNKQSAAKKEWLKQTVAKKYPAANDIEAACEGAATAINAYTQAAGDISALFAANTQMETAMTELYRTLDDTSLSEKDEKYRQRLYTDFNSRNDTISHDPYYSYAADYNKLLAQFPANVIAALTPAAAAPMMR